MSNAVGVATLITATTMIAFGYRLGRTHSAWRDVRDAKRSVRSSRKVAWRHTASLAIGIVTLLVALGVIGYDLASP